MIDPRRGQDAPQRGGRGKQKGLAAKRGQVVDNLRIAPDRNAEEEKQEVDGPRDGAADRTQRLDPPQQVAQADSGEHDGDDDKHFARFLPAKIRRRLESVKWRVGDSLR